MTIEEDVRVCLRGCFYCTDSETSGLLPRMPNNDVHASMVGEVVRVEVVYLGTSKLVGGVGTRDNLAFTLVILGDVNSQM